MLAHQLLKQTVSTFTVDITFHRNLALAFSGVGILESLISLIMQIKGIIEQSAEPITNTLGQDWIRFGAIAYNSLQLPLYLMNILVAGFFAPGTTHTGWALGLSIFSAVVSTLSLAGFALAPYIYTMIWEPETFAGMDEMSVFKMIYMRVLSLVVNLTSSVETLNYTIDL